VPAVFSCGESLIGLHFGTLIAGVREFPHARSIKDIACRQEFLRTDLDNGHGFGSGYTDAAGP